MLSEESLHNKQIVTYQISTVSDSLIQSKSGGLSELLFATHFITKEHTGVATGLYEDVVDLPLNRRVFTGLITTSGPLLFLALCTF